MQKKIYIIGGGIAGLSTAYYALKKGWRAEIFEASEQFGGRCRSYFDKELGEEIDNGNHLILNANENVMSLISELDVKDRFYSPEKPKFQFYDVKNDSAFTYKPYLSGLKDISLLEKIGFLKFILFRQPYPVKQAFIYSPILLNNFIKNISTSILNTSIEQADAEILRQVFLKIIKNGKNGFKYYYPKKNWSDALINPLAEKVIELGGVINKGARLTSFKTLDNKINQLIFNDKKTLISDRDNVVCATPAQAANKIFNLPIPEKYNAILNIHFATNQDNGHGIVGVNNSATEWIFKKGSIISTTTSDYKPVEKNSHEQIAAKAWNDISKTLGLPAEIPSKYKVIIEKRATFSCETGELKKRPSFDYLQKQNNTETLIKNLSFAGDYTDTGLPATIEGAVKSGQIATNLYNLFKVI